MKLRIVRTRRGDLITGFRVQMETYGRLPDQECKGPRWVNTGRKCFSMEQAREYMGWLEKHMQREAETVEVMEGHTGEPRSKYLMPDMRRY